MYRHKTTSNEEIKSFLDRYELIQSKLPQAEEQAQQNKEEYRRLCKLKYNLELAQNKQYCYGPEYQEPQEQDLSPSQQQKRERTNE